MKISNLLITSITIAVCLLILSNCNNETLKPGCDLDILPASFPATASAYAEMVDADLGRVPTVYIDSMIEIPLYQSGTQVYGAFTSSQIDNPTRLGKSTVSGSALQRFEGTATDGTPLPNVVWVAFLRNSTENVSNIVGSLQMIGYNRETGATAFFESTDNIGRFVSSIDPVTFSLTGVMPGLDTPTEFNQAYITPSGGFQCIACHQADPFITNPFINAAVMPGTLEPVVPQLGADAPYYVIGGETWDMRTVHIEGNQCLACHRVGLYTVQLFEGSGYDVNAHMPPHDPGSLSADYIELISAWLDGVENTPNAEWVIPAVGAPGPNQVVGDDYPYKACHNEPDSDGK